MVQHYKQNFNVTVKSMLNSSTSNVKQVDETGPNFNCHHNDISDKVCTSSKLLRSSVEDGGDTSNLNATHLADKEDMTKVNIKIFVSALLLQSPLFDER